MTATIGIDLGTTYSLGATLQGDHAVVLRNAVGELLTPSAVSVDEQGRVLVGAPALARAATQPEVTAVSFKRDMGTNRTFELQDKRFRPEELSALVLAQVRRDAEDALGMPVREAVVTVPAYFGELQRRATRDACEIAGLPVERIINEPTAAALAYGLHQLDRELRAVVLDLGGGTFDVTVLEIIEGVVEIQASAGDVRLGGEDFLDALMALASQRIRADHKGEVTPGRPLARLRQACEELKKRLSGEAIARLALPGLELEGRREVDVELALTRDEVEASWNELLLRIRAPIRRALNDASAGTADIDEVLLVGGATRMPAIAQLAATMFGRMPLRALPPDEAVAMGAAVQAGLKEGNAAVSEMVVTDIAPFTLGIATAESLGSHLVEGLFTPILERGTVLPASRIKSFSTIADNQDKLYVQVFQGEHSLCRDNQKLGEYTVRGIPKAKAGVQTVDIRFTYDLNGILEVEATVRATGKTSTLVIEKAPGRLSPDEIDEARENMKRLKFHPRDALPNVTALARADRLYAELRGIERETLGQYIGRLRAALETQDAEVIRGAREDLLGVIATFDR